MPVATEVPEFPITWYHPTAGVVQEFEDAQRLATTLPNLDTDDITVNSGQWLVDKRGRRVRARITGTAVERLEILPGRPPLPETLATMREKALRLQEDREGDIRTALYWARSGGYVLAPCVALAIAVNVFPLLADPALIVESWEQIFIIVALVGTAGVLATQFGSRRYVFWGLSLVLGSAVALGAVRGWRLVAVFTGPGSRVGLRGVAKAWVLDLALPFLLFFISAMLIVFFGQIYLSLARRRS